MKRTATATAIASAIAAMSVASSGHALETIGWVEPVAIEGGGVLIDAKIDTGADTSSINANDIRFFERDGAQWVSFGVDSADSKRRTFERQVIRTVRVKRVAGGSERRPKVRLGVCLGNIYVDSEVNLSARHSMKFPMLIGRNFLRGHFLVDSARQKLTVPACSKEVKK